ncbi:Putative bacteriophage related protein OS=Isosphaera pallida (strain ATCC 43644 / DSM 9630 / IS1B) GN=Isop_2454 PE=4 SV=1: DUF2924 [Gemmataceae bacterium]|nr:Putative bacteriophage related protein OS=Isosphaera pallida (strain ATCC 43644 / DSM 9630 / IS1B) GN=Isop_2454 PE=4 SV=1: DUF2924 [Gemmataceae bacterium]VTU02563.1 Putative bacteriophage related protein OS=Isosphaera pallida (strain ATCC 43644 / DSM 9630 / IS1B) GN=Isop_2454 PE=4 SV=1: DUF2924 [Gemmataceae bacterium]
MGLNVAKEVAALQRMTPKELARKFADLFGEPTNARNRTRLVRRIAGSSNPSPRVSTDDDVLAALDAVMRRG